MQPGLLKWVMVLALGFPMLMIALGEVTFILEKRQHPLRELVEILRNWVLPSLTTVILLQKIIRLPESNFFYRLAETILWLALIYWGLTLINILLFQKAKQGTWRANVPKIFLDLSRTFLVLVGTAVVLSTVWDADLAGLLTALGVGSLVIGLALQDSLGNIFSGITLLFEKPIAIGDWVEIGDIQGQVREITWRSVHIYTLQKHLVIVPNSELAKGSFKNYSGVEPLHGVEIEIKFSVDDPPNKVIEVHKKIALETKGVLKEPPPKVFLTSLDDWFIMYKTVLFVENYVQGIESKHEFQLRMWYASQRYDLTMPYPISIEYHSPPLTAKYSKQKALEVLRKAPGWNLLENSVLEKTYQASRIESFAKGELIIQENQPLKGLFVILEGQAEMSVSDEHHQKVVGYLVEGEIFGENSVLLSGQISDTTITAVEDVEVLIVDLETLQSTMRNFPILVSKLGELMELRRQQIQSIINDIS